MVLLGQLEWRRQGPGNTMSTETLAVQGEGEESWRRVLQSEGRVHVVIKKEEEDQRDFIRRACED